MQNRLLAMNYIYEGDDDKLFNAHRLSLAFRKKSGIGVLDKWSKIKIASIKLFLSNL